MNNYKLKKLELDSLWSHAVKCSFGYRCALTGGIGTDAHHLRRRSCLASRWVVLNGVCLSREAHSWAHAHSGDFLSWMQEALPAHYRALTSRASDEALNIRDVDFDTVRYELNHAISHPEVVMPIPTSRGIPPSILL